MDENWPNHGKLTSKFTAMGPYFRIESSDKQRYFFDCFATCVSAKVAAEIREFYGWHFVLTISDNTFQYQYQYGLYNKHGEWVKKAIPAKHSKNVTESLHDFYAKLLATLAALELEIEPAASLSDKQQLPAA